MRLNADESRPTGSGSLTHEIDGETGAALLHPSLVLGPHDVRAAHVPLGLGQREGVGGAIVADLVLLAVLQRLTVEDPGDLGGRVALDLTGEGGRVALWGYWRGMFSIKTPLSITYYFQWGKSIF